MRALLLATLSFEEIQKRLRGGCREFGVVDVQREPFDGDARANSRFQGTYEGLVCRRHPERPGRDAEG